LLGEGKKGEKGEGKKVREHHRWLIFLLNFYYHSLTVNVNLEKGGRRGKKRGKGGGEKVHPAAHDHLKFP